MPQQEFRSPKLQRALQGLSLAALSLLTFNLGCGGPPAATVSGVVQIDGKPLTSGTLAFYPVGTGRPAIGQIGADGGFSLTTTDQAPLAPGRYVATVVALSATPSDNMASQHAESLFLTPQRYSDITTSGLEYEVVPGRNTFTIELVSASPK